MVPIRCRAACNKALRPTIRSKLSLSGDVMIQNVAFARRFSDVLIATTPVVRSVYAGIAVKIAELPPARLTRSDALVRI
jgi:hypothetical protein